MTEPIIAERARSLRVLVADDDPVNTMIVTMLLRKRGHVTVVVENGREAVLAASSGGFDLVLMDVQMPEMDGNEATAMIRKTEQTTGDHVPILALTAELKSADRDACIAAGADGYLSKPITPASLFAKIESVLVASQPLS
jgi:two-component system sensor histidine kinase/response regulator